MMSSEVSVLEPPVWGRRLSGPVTAELSPVTLAPHQLVADGGVIGGFTVRATSVAGVIHQMYGQPRQDAYHVRGDGRLVAASVCDGVGSAAHAEHGATVAAMAATLCMLELFADLMPVGDGSDDVDGEAFSTLAPARARLLVDRVAGVLVDVAAEKGWDAAGLSATLACVLVAPSVSGANVVAARVGDSNIRVLKDCGWVSVFAGSEDGGPTNRTAAIPRDREPELAVTDFPSAGPLLLLSDGIDVPLGESRSVSYGLAERWLVPPTLASFVNDVQFVKVDAYDDRAALAIWPREQR